MRHVLPPAALLAAVAAGVAMPSGAPGSAAPDLPSGAVARVDDATISRTRFQHWFGVSIRATPPQRDRARDYRPPSFAGCVARERRAQRKARPRPATARLRRRCKARYERSLRQALEFLILERWVAGESAERGIVLTAQELESAYQEAKRASFQDDAEFRRYLRASGMTVADTRLQIAFNTRYERLRQTALARVASVTDAEVADHYERNRDEFTLPERRDVRIVLTRTRAAAVAARRGLERGQTWRHVARRYSVHSTSRGDGGLLRGISRPALGRAFDDAAFGAPAGRLRGPVKGALGYFVFKVLAITPSRQRTLAEASTAIREQLAAERQKSASDGFDRDLRTRWKPRTTCRAGFVIDLCAGTPDPAAASASSALAPT